MTAHRVASPARWLHERVGEMLDRMLEKRTGFLASSARVFDFQRPWLTGGCPVIADRRRRRTFNYTRTVASRLLSQELGPEVSQSVGQIERARDWYPRSSSPLVARALLSDVVATRVDRRRDAVA